MHPCLYSLSLCKTRGGVLVKYVVALRICGELRATFHKNTCHDSHVVNSQQLLHHPPPRRQIEVRTCRSTSNVGFLPSEKQPTMHLTRPSPQALFITCFCDFFLVSTGNYLCTSCLFAFCQWHCVSTNWNILFENGNT